MTMSTAVDFHSQIASIMEVLANAAVVEICKVVDDSYAAVQLEMSRSLKESDYLRRRVKLLELQIARYRAERGRAAGPSSQSRTRFLNRGPGAVQKDQTLKGDQNPIQEVVTTIKIEAEEVMEQDERELLIIKVREASETTEETSPVPGTTTSEDGLPQRESSAGQPSSRRMEWEAAEAMKQNETELLIIKVEEATGSTAETPPRPGTATRSEVDPSQRKSSTGQLSSRRKEWEHPTHFRGPPDIQVYFLDGIYKCPCCKFSTDYDFSFNMHMNNHIHHAVQHEDYKICKCNLQCRPTAHFHCLFCPQTIIRKDQVKSHFLHCKSSSLSPASIICPPVKLVVPHHHQQLRW